MFVSDTQINRNTVKALNGEAVISQKRFID